MAPQLAKEVKMQTVQVTISASKETHELAVGLGKLIKAIKTATVDGFQVGQDLPVIISSAITDLVPALEGATLISEEAKNTPEFQNACYLAAQEIYSALK